MHALVQGSAFWGFDYKHLNLTFCLPKVENVHYGLCAIWTAQL